MSRVARIAIASATAGVLIGSVGAFTLVRVAHAATSGDTITYTSGQVGTSGQTASFSESGNWTMAWTYTCPSGSQQQNFIVNVNQPSGDLSPAVGPDELGTGGSGTDHYAGTGTGTFSLSVMSGCSWTIIVAPDIAPPLGPSTTFTSTQTGQTGNTAQFTETGPWTMAWTYTCLSGSQQQNFIVNVNHPSGDLNPDVGPDELGTGGSGTDHYSDTGTFSLTVISGCSWTIAINGPIPTPSCDTTLSAGIVVGMAVTPDGGGYWIASSSGQVVACGDAPVLGNGQTGTTAIAAAPSGDGYWLATGGGSVEAFGTAVDYGEIPATLQLAKPIVAMAADPATGGYWLLGGDGGVFSFNAPFFGSTGNIRLNAPAVGMEATPDGLGYRFVASDGGIFDYGDATFYGSTGAIKLNKPVIGMADDPATGGYWLDAADGGIFSFNAPFYGSAGNITLTQPCIGMTSMPNGGGYRFVAADGGIFDFGSAAFEGSAA